MYCVVDHVPTQNPCLSLPTKITIFPANVVIIFVTITINVVDTFVTNYKVRI